MNTKDKYLQALKANKGQLNEIDLGESIDIDEEATRKIISLLLSEHKIEYAINGACNYKIRHKKVK